MPANAQVVLGGVPLLTVANSYRRYKSPYQKVPQRLGDPTGLGIAGTWRQSSWVGGQGQGEWKDPEMFLSGDADTRFPQGVQCKFGLVERAGSIENDTSWKSMVVRSVTETGPTYLYTADGDERYLYKQTTLAGAQTQIFDAGVGLRIRGLGRSGQGGTYGMHIGLNDGKLFSIASASETVGATAGWNASWGGVAFIDTLGSRGDIVGAGRQLAVGANSTWKTIGAVDTIIKDGAAWNQRIYFVGTDERNVSKLYQTDGLTIQELHSWNAGFIARGIRLHYGVLYILGHTFDEEYTKQVGQIWAYNGASTRLLYEVTDEVYSKYPSYNYWGFWRAVSYRKWLVFSYPHKGLWAYDPEKDAFHSVAQLIGAQDNANDYVSSMVTFGGKLVAWNTNESEFHYEGTYKQYRQSWLTSSQYDAGLPNTEKLWTELRWRVDKPLTGAAKIEFYLTSDDVELEDVPGVSVKWTKLGEITSSTTGQAGSFKIAGNVSFPDFRSTKIRYGVRITPTTYTGSASNVSPRLQSLELDFYAADDGKLAWSFTSPCADNLTSPDGTLYTGPDTATAPTPGTPDYASGTALETALLTMLRGTGKNIVSFTDKDNTTYQVKIMDHQQMVRQVDSDNPDGESSMYSFTLVEA